MYIPISTQHEAFWELTGFGFHENSEVKRVARESTPMMGDPLGSSRVSSQKQNREGVVGAQIGQYHATVVERAWDVTIWYQSLTLAVVCRRGLRAPKGVGL